ncbi:PLP-dependent aminotransferase family protein [Metallosphaera tengchongensis]|uniref:PLP-dependent aminotransferase family protein n=1 Tax=Metallosphaera tengchongensis TaxID=1532350 RepID=A0A6N0NY14_9CREN|nr:PLP-dependent aminotransferase family protein [Metallosphaera tengchongensis]QKR00011.1 PLP-dependent aminotransferase family protein [Metallosphaera tengchongensis]
MVSRIGKEIELSPVEMGSRIGRTVEINMASGTPDPRTIPVNEIRDTFQEVLDEIGSKSLFYPGAGGQQDLIEEIEKYLPRLGISKMGRVVVTSGAQHALELISKYLLQDDIIAVENPTFVETFMALKLRSAVSLPIYLDKDGISIEELEKVTKIVKPKLVYTIPNCHNPAGVNMSEDRRKRLVELSEERDFFIVEDDPYRPIAGCLPKPIKEYDRSGKVIYVSSFSKILAPGLRIGFVFADEIIGEKLSLLEQLDFSTSTLNQYVIAKILRKGLIYSRMESLSLHYKEKMGVLVDSLMDAGFHNFNVPKCGFFLLVDLGVNADVVLNETAKRGLSFVPAKAFFLRGGDTMARLSITMPSEEQIKSGVKILKDVVSSMRN